MPLQLFVVIYYYFEGFFKISSTIYQGKKNMLSFYKALLKNPRSIGAVIPSSVHLAHAVANFVLPNKDKLVIELGAGTGVITQALLNQGIDPDRIIAIESSEDLVKKLKSRFPRIKILHGDAAHLSQLLEKQNLKVGTVICGLPFLILPQEKVTDILQQIDKVLGPGGRYIKYTYGTKDIWAEKLHYKKYAIKRIWLNIPPARICVYEVPN